MKLLRRSGVAEKLPLKNCRPLLNWYAIDKNSCNPGLVWLKIITSNDRPFGCSIIYMDIFSQCYFAHRHLQQCIIQTISFSN